MYRLGACAVSLAAILLVAPAVHARVHVVEIAGGVFVPAALHLEAGDTLRVVNRDGVPHTFTASDGSFDSGRLMDGDATQLVVASAGAHTFHCSLGGQEVLVTVEAHIGAVRHDAATPAAFHRSGR